MYPLQNPRASKSATHGFASKSDTRHKTPKVKAFGVFICVRRTQHHSAARRTQMNDVELRANDVLRNDVVLCTNEVAFHANGMKMFAQCAEI